MHLPERHLTAKCSSGAAQRPEVEDCGCAEQLPAVNVSSSINVKQGIDKESIHAQQILPGWKKAGEKILVWQVWLNLQNVSENTLNDQTKNGDEKPK